MSELDAYGLLMSTLDDLESTALRIKEQRDDLLAALESVIPEIAVVCDDDLLEQARTAIKKAKA